MEDAAGWSGAAVVAGRMGPLGPLRRAVRAIVIPGVWLGVSLGSTGNLRAEPADEAIAIARSIEQLGAPQFARREASFRSLLQAGRPAIGPLAAAASASDLEVASRSVEILREMLSSADAPLAAEAAVVLAGIAGRNRPPVAQLAAAALDFHRAAQAARARDRLTSLGAILNVRLVDAEGPDIEVELNPAWRGDTDDLAQLVHLERLECVRVHGVRLDDASVEILARLPAVRRIDLYGTSLGPAAVAALAARLPTTVVDARKGGKLGVRSVPAAGNCQISHVQAGSAAERAGLSPGDVIEHLDGRPVAHFEEFTRLMAGLGPGETVTVGIARAADDGLVERLEPTVRLDSW